MNISFIRSRHWTCEMEGEHTPTIIQLILSTDLAVIQLKNSHLILHISGQLKHSKFSPGGWGECWGTISALQIANNTSLDYMHTIITYTHVHIVCKCTACVFHSITCVFDFEWELYLQVVLRHYAKACTVKNKAKFKITKRKETPYLHFSWIYLLIMSYIFPYPSPNVNIISHSGSIVLALCNTLAVIKTLPLHNCFEVLTALQFNFQSPPQSKY